MKEEDVIKNIIQIRNYQGLTKRYMANALNINEASYGRIENCKIALSYNQLAQIASIFNMPVVDVITYPDVYVKQACKIEEQEPVEAILQIKLKKERKEQVLKLVFGDNNIEIFNK